ncbi:MAG: hypothetical protein QOC60_1136 [Frankiaceae bacterium]|nr:hypothetical protein [Frankiaceae bacterium]
MRVGAEVGPVAGPEGWPFMTAPDVCRCGHGREAHEHYRAGNECALCDCRNYRTSWWRRLFRS